MAGINKVILVGNLGKDLEVMTYDNGVKRGTFSIATTESYKDKEGNWVEQTEWHNIVVWRWLAEKDLIKGDKIYLEGRLRSRKYDDKDGVTKYITEIQADKILKLGSSGGGANQEAPPPAATAATVNEGNTPEASTPSTQVEAKDDLPF
ncbi:MAG: single-stranded DNA-binding protein [Bacteroidales bacterium]|nr:single-stranded DNA-binding protein [Bacteroidales bacterium]